MYTSGTPNAASASRWAVLIAWPSSCGVRTTRMPRPPPPAVAFTMTGKPHVIGKLQRVFFVLDRTVGARQQRQAGLLHRAPRARLVAHQANHLRIGPDEPDVAGLADFGEVRRFRQEAVAGMDRVGAGDFRGADDRRDVQIALGAARRADAHVLVGEPHVQRVLVGLRIHRHGLDAELAARDDDAHRDLAAVRDQDFFKHCGFDGEQPLAVLHGLAVLDVDLHDLAVVLGVDLVHQLHRFDDAEHLPLLHGGAHIDERRGARLGRRGRTCRRSATSRSRNRLRRRAAARGSARLRAARRRRGGRLRRRRRRLLNHRHRERSRRVHERAFLDPDLEAFALELELAELVLAHHIQNAIDLVKFHASV